MVCLHKLRNGNHDSSIFGGGCCYCYNLIVLSVCVTMYAAAVCSACFSLFRVIIVTGEFAAPIASSLSMNFFPRRVGNGI